MAKKRDVAQDVKNTAGSAFETMHNALEATENAAMNAVDATSEAIENLTDDRDNQDNR